MKAKEDFSVLIPDGQSPQALGVLQCLGQMKNVRTYILSNDKRTSIRFSRHSTQFFSYLKGVDNEGRLEAIYNTIKKVNVDVVLPVDCKGIRFLSANSDSLSQLTSIAPLPETKAMDIALDKWLLAEWLKKNHIPCPPTILYQKNDSFDECLSTIRFPVLIKPTLGGMGKGIKLFDKREALYSFFKSHVISEEFIVQSFINGYDIDCSVLCKEGKILAHTIQKGFINGPNPFGAPAGIDFLFDGCTFKVVKEVVEKLNWSGVAHFDLRYDEEDKQVKVIEMNPRFWGSVLGSLCAGVNFPYLACLTGLKRDLPEIMVQPIRFVQGKVAIKITTQRLLGRKRTDLYYDNSIIEFLLKDPLPNMFGVYFKIYNKIFPKK